jgi:hypothetical protein
VFPDDDECVCPATISEETRKLIVQVATEDPRRARKIEGELAKLGIGVSLAAIARYLPQAKPRPAAQMRSRLVGRPIPARK